MKEGKFIVFEGLDGSGLSTQSSLLKEYLTKKGKNVILTKEPTDSAIGGLIKSALKKDFATSALALQLLFVADRSHHLEKEIEPALKDGKIVISDRYIFSTIAYGSLSLDEEFLKVINSKFRKPDITFILDCKPEVCLERIKGKRLRLEIFEEKEKMERIRKNYLALKNYFPNAYVVDANKKIEEVFKDVRKIVDASFS